MGTCQATLENYWFCYTLSSFFTIQLSGIELLAAINNSSLRICWNSGGQWVRSRPPEGWSGYRVGRTSRQRLVLTWTFCMWSRNIHWLQPVSSVFPQQKRRWSSDSRQAPTSPFPSLILPTLGHLVRLHSAGVITTEIHIQIRGY